MAGPLTIGGAPTFSQVGFAPMLKTLWYNKALQNLALKNNPALSIVSKNTEFDGDSMKVPLSIVDMQGLSATFSVAQANVTASVYNAFLLTRNSYYGIGQVTGETIEAAKTNKGSFIRSFTSEVSKGKNSMTRMLAVQMYRTSTGVIAQTTALPSGTTMNVSLSDAYNLEVGMVLGAVSDNTGTGTVRTGTATITGINRQFSATAGQITYTGTITGLTSGDFLYRQGDYNATLSGFADWIPVVAPGATSFFGVDRSTDVTRLGGLRYTTNQPVEEALQTALANQYSAGGQPDYGFINPYDMGNLINSLGSKVNRTKVTGEAGTGYSAVVVDSPAGEIKMVSDVNCPRSLIYLLQMDTWTLNSLGDAPHILDYGDGQSLRVGNADAQEFRMGFRAQLGCSAPGYNQVVQLTS